MPNPNPVAIPITVTGSGTPESPHAIAVQDRVHAGPLNTPAAITWNIGTTGWVFQSSGIAFKADPNRQINNSHGAGQPGAQTRWVANDANTVAGDLDYTINLSGPSSTPLSLDPTIVNGSQA